MNERDFSGITFQDAVGEIRHVSYVKGLNDALAYDQSKVAYQLHKAYMRRVSSSDYAWIVYRNSTNETVWVQWPDMPSTTEN